MVWSGIQLMEGKTAGISFSGNTWDWNILWVQENNQSEY